MNRYQPEEHRQHRRASHAPNADRVSGGVSRHRLRHGPRLLVHRLTRSGQPLGDARIRVISEATHDRQSHCRRAGARQVRCRGRACSVGPLDFSGYRAAVVFQRIERLGNGLSLSRRSVGPAPVSSNFSWRIEHSLQSLHKTMPRQFNALLLSTIIEAYHPFPPNRHNGRHNERTKEKAD